MSFLSPELVSRANFNMLVWCQTFGRKLAIGIDHLWTWARFMAAQILATNIAVRIYNLSTAIVHS